MASRMISFLSQQEILYRIIEGKISLWAPIKKNKLKLCSSARKKVSVKIAGTVTELSADRSLFARLLVVTRSQRQVDLSETLGIYELSVVPRSMFASDGTMLLCQGKSELMHILKEKDKPTTKSAGEQNLADMVSSFSVVIVDGIAELQAIEKTKVVKTCQDMSRLVQCIHK